GEGTGRAGIGRGATRVCARHWWLHRRRGQRQAEGGQGGQEGADAPVDRAPLKQRPRGSVASSAWRRIQCMASHPVHVSPLSVARGGPEGATPAVVDGSVSRPCKVPPAGTLPDISQMDGVHPRPWLGYRPCDVAGKGVLAS